MTSLFSIFVALVCYWCGNRVLIPFVFFFFFYSTQALSLHTVTESASWVSLLRKIPKLSLPQVGSQLPCVYSVALHPDTVDGLGQQLPLVTGTEDMHTSELWAYSLGLVYTHQRGEESHKLKSADLLRRAELAVMRGRQQPEWKWKSPRLCKHCSSQI